MADVTKKITVWTDGDYMMQDPMTLEVVEAYGKSEITHTGWVDAQIVNGKLKSDTKVEAEEVQNPGTEVTSTEQVRAKAPDRGEVRGASKSKNPATIDKA